MLTERVRVQRRAVMVSSTGSVTQTWADHGSPATRWAHVEQGVIQRSGGGEEEQADGAVERRHATIAMRWFADLLATDRIIHRGVAWNIATVDQDTHRHFFTIAKCVRSDDQPGVP
jgi:head-tail adaptor